MTTTPPTPPQGLPGDVVDTLESTPPEQLRLVARYADELAEYRDRIERIEEEDDTEEELVRDGPSDVPADVPSKASLTVKEINDNRYYYWQWRDGDQIKSQYEGPVDADR